MKGDAWYVIQVQTGREEATCETIERECRIAQQRDPSCMNLLKECFSPRYAYRHKRRGEWVDESMLLLPGYVIAVTGNPSGLKRVLQGVPDFTRLLTMGETFTPLDDSEKSWIERWTHEGDRTIPMSIAYKKGDLFQITEGPLVGREAMITRINRRKCVAHLEIHAGQITIHTTVGLAVLPGQEEPGKETP